MRKVFVAITGLSLLLFVSAVVIAQEIESSPASDELPTPAPSVEYFLPYPGLLPDHPLYLIKAFRDKIVSILITDPVKRIEFNLLMADKRLNMGIFLSDKGKEKLAETTVSKGEKYFAQSVEEFVMLKSKEQVSGVLYDKLKNASAKHKIIITELSEKSPDMYKAGYQASFDLSEQAQQSLNAL